MKNDLKHLVASFLSLYEKSIAHRILDHLVLCMDVLMSLRDSVLCLFVYIRGP